MLFHEVFGSYYDTVATVLREAVNGTLTQKRLTELVRRKAFSESLLTIPEGLRGERWRLMHADLTTPIREAPTMPLTELQKRWLKALLLDARIRLFSPDTSGLEDVAPLFTPDMIVYYDRYTDGDDYSDPGYIERFGTILEALREKRDLRVCFDSPRRGNTWLVVRPQYLEYSEKDDRFRLVALSRRGRWTINLGRVTHCELTDREAEVVERAPRTASITFELNDTRNALERVLLHFSHLQKETERLDENRYRVTLRYDTQDETELVIRILSFGPVIKVTEPQSFIALLRERIERQTRFATNMPGKGAETGL